MISGHYYLLCLTFSVSSLYLRIVCNSFLASIFYTHAIAWCASLRLHVRFYMCASTCVQMLLRVRADRRRAREKMARVSSGLWNEELIYAIPEGDNTKSLDSSSTPLISEESEIGFNGGGSGIEMTAMASKAESGVTIEPEDNPYSLIKGKVNALFGVIRLGL